MEHPHPQIRQRFYHTVGLPPCCFVDACAQVHGRAVVFGPQDAFLTLFDRGGVLRRGETATVFDVRGQVESLARCRWRRVLVEKELARGHGLEALAYYHREVLSPLVELLRLRHCPDRRDFGLKHVYHDLPPEVVRRLGDLYARTRPHEISLGVEQAGE